MQSLVRVAARRLAKGPSFLSPSAISSPVPLSRPSLTVPEAPYWGLLRHISGTASNPSKTASNPSKTASNPTSEPQTPRKSNSGAMGGKAPAPQAVKSTQTGGEEPPPTPALRLVTFGGPANRKLHDVGGFFQKNDVLQKVPKNRLITPIAGRPYLFPDLGRWLIRSAFIIPFLSHRRKCSSKGVFKEGNVGVLQGLHAFALKELFPSEVADLTEAMKREGYQEARNFVIKKFEDVYGKDVLDQFPGLQDLFTMIDTVPMSEENEIEIVNHVALLSRESTAILNQRMRDTLLKVIPIQHRGLTSQALVVYDQMPYTRYTTTLDPSELWLTIARQDIWLSNWIDYDDQKLPDYISPGRGLCELHRHGCTGHWMEKNVQKIIKKLSKKRQRALRARPITREDVLDLFYYAFPKFTSSTYALCRQRRLSRFLKKDELFYIPAWYT